MLVTPSPGQRPTGESNAAPTLSGRLTTPDGEPIPDVLVTLYSGVATRFRGQRVATDSNGEFAFDPLRTGARLRKDDGTAYRFTGVEFEHPTLVPADGRSWRDVTVPIRGGNEVLDLAMTLGGTIRGVVADRESGEPISELDLRIHNGPAGSSDTGTFLVYATSDEEGAFQTGPLFPGDYFIEVNDNNYRGELRYPRLGRVRVEAGGLASVELVDRPMRVTPTERSRVASDAAPVTPSTRDAFEATPPKPTASLAQRPPAGAATISDEEGAPVVGAHVLVATRLPTGRSQLDSYITDSKGAFLFASEPNLVSRVRFIHGGYLPFTSAARRSELLHRLTAVKPKAGHGVVRLPDGGPIPARLYTRLERFNKNEEPTYLRGVGEVLSTTSTSNGMVGRFALSDLPNAPTDLFIEAVDGSRVLARQLSRTEGLQVVLPQRRDFVVAVEGDATRWPANELKTLVRLTQSIEVKDANGDPRRIEVTGVRPIESRKGRRFALFHGLVADASDPNAELDVVVALEPGGRPKRLQVAPGGPQGVTLKL